MTIRVDMVGLCSVYHASQNNLEGNMKALVVRWILLCMYAAYAKTIENGQKSHVVRNLTYCGLEAY